MDAAASRKHDPRAHLYIDDFVAPGSVVVRHVQVFNYTKAPAHLNLYADPASIGPAGWSVAEGHGRNELTNWITVSPSTADVAPDKSVIATVHIAVPRTASAGERYAVILAEQPGGKPTRAHPFRVTSRVGVRVYLDIGAGGEPRSDFAISTLTAARDKDGVPQVTAAVTNTGRRAIDVSGTLELTDGPGGLRAGPFAVTVPRTIGIGESAGVVVRLDRQVPAGPWKARLDLRSGYVEHAVTGRITFPTAAGESAAPVHATAVPLTRNRDVVVPVAIGLLLFIALLGLLLWWRRRRREDNTDEPRQSGPLLAQT
jgi:hypothetical protein